MAAWLYIVITCYHTICCIFFHSTIHNFRAQMCVLPVLLQHQKFACKACCHYYYSHYDSMKIKSNRTRVSSNDIIFRPHFVKMSTGSKLKYTHAQTNTTVISTAYFLIFNKESRAEKVYEKLSEFSISL